MTDMKSPKTVTIEIVVPPYEQTALSDAGVYTQYIDSECGQKIAEQISQGVVAIPIKRSERFDYATHNNIHYAEYILLDKQSLEDNVVYSEKAKQDNESAKWP
ncbi:hypothetical protein [Bacillus sp. 1P06AnD]|uniref:hypothetical protein n=1 Tax=Bacillus sp. 1P06AnD TaxID=3132208 RepID=UPI0039A392FF